ncbi:MAG: hydrogenase maturation protease [Actinomycetia bacterium]|nr:hydrogenase maturation protease [Actinomycetes bacterium]
MARVVLIGLGNPILSDDGVGLAVVREARRHLEGLPVEVVEASVGGLGLLDLLAGHERAVLVDAVLTGRAEPGEVLELDAGFLEDTSHLGTAGVSHQVDLATAWQLGRRLGLPLPGRLRIFGVEAADVKTFSESLTPAVRARLGEAVEAVVAAVREELDGGDPGCTSSAS